MIYSLYIMKLDSGSILLKRSYIAKFMINEHLIVGALSAINSLFKEGHLGEINSIKTKKFKNIYYFDEEKNLMIIVITPLIVKQSEKLNQIIYEVSKKMIEIYGEDNFYDFSGNVSIFDKNTHFVDEIVYNYDTEWLYEKYPQSFVTKIKRIQEDLKPEIIKQIGFSTGMKIASLYKVSSYIIQLENLKGELKKFADFEFRNDNEFIFNSCPFCKGYEINKKEPSCKFLEGFIKGFLKTDKVLETRCIRAGDNSCNFIIC